MAVPPLRTELSDTYPNPSNATARAGFGKLWDYVTDLLGMTGNAVDARAALGVAEPPHGHCRLSKSGANLVLSRFCGKTININGLAEEIPSGGVTLAATGLTPSTLYYIYAYMNAGTMTLEVSATGHVADATTGVEIKTGDATRTLVGMARPITGPAFQDTENQRFVRSWFNDQGIAGLAKASANVGLSSTTYIELSTSTRIEFLSWLGEIVRVVGSGMSSNNTAGSSNYNGVGFDGATLEPGSYSTGFVAGIANNGITYAFSLAKSGLAEGYHYATSVARVSAGAGTWFSTATAEACSINLSSSGA